jgi:hypothetical protein
MSITIDLTHQEIVQLKQITQHTGDTEAVSQAVRDFLRQSRLRELKSVSGKLDFADPSATPESLEIADSPFPE